MSAKAPLFSVVVPAYNWGKGLLTLVEHFDATGFTDFELLIIDDESKDDTEAIFSTFRHPRVRYFRKTNGERGAARNYGADRATGKYVCFFDQDDEPYKFFFEEAAKCISAFYEPDAFCLGLEVRNTQGRITWDVKDLPDPLNLQLLKGNSFGCGGVFVKREILKEVRFEENRDIVGTEDWLFLLQLAARYSVRFWNKVCWAYLDTGNNSVYRFTEKDLNNRGALLLSYLRADPAFMQRYGGRISDIAAMRDVYTALHLAISGKVLRPFFYLKRAFFKRPAGILRRATLGTVKTALKNLAVTIVRFQ